MIYRKLDPNGDMLAGQGQYDFLIDIEAIAQAIKTRLLLLYNEWWEDLEEGLPFFEQIAGNRNIQQATTIIRQRIMTTIGVKHISNLIVEFSDRNLIITANIDTIYGTYSLYEEVKGNGIFSTLY